MIHFTAQQTATRLGISKQGLLVAAREGRVKPDPKKMTGSANAPWLFSGNAKIVIDKRAIK